MRRILLPALLLLALPLCTSAEPQKNGKIKALLVTGGGYHDYKKLNPILTEKIPQYGAITFDVKSGVETLKDPKFADGYDVVVYNFCFADEKDKDLIENALKVIRDGKPAVMIHCGMRTRRHDPYRAFAVIKTEAKDHPITSFLPEKWDTAGDELYQTIKLGDRSTALLRGQFDKGKSDHIVCWVSTYGKGKVFATTLGHDLKTVNMPEYHHLLANGILWACDKLGKDGKPLEGYGGTGAK